MASRRGSCSFEGPSGQRLQERRLLRPCLEWRAFALFRLLCVCCRKRASEHAISRQTGHTPDSTVLRNYIRHASASTDNAVSMDPTSSDQSAAGSFEQRVLPVDVAIKVDDRPSQHRSFRLQ